MLWGNSSRCFGVSDLVECISEQDLLSVGISSGVMVECASLRPRRVKVDINLDTEHACDLNGPIMQYFARWSFGREAYDFEFPGEEKELIAKKDSK